MGQVCSGMRFYKTSGQDRVPEISSFYYSVLYYGPDLLTLRIIFDFKKSFSKNVPFVNKKAHVLEILSIFLNLKLITDFPRKMGSNIVGNL
jgi:hypothetical protein